MEIKEFLVEKKGYNPRTVDMLVNDLEKLDAPLKQALRHWMETGEETDTEEAYGYTVRRLMEDFQMNYPAALTTYAWILREGEKAVRLVKRGIK